MNRRGHNFIAKINHFDSEVVIVIIAIATFLINHQKQLLFCKKMFVLFFGDSYPARRAVDFTA